jgi:hypothetical protein
MLQPRSHLDLRGRYWITLPLERNTITACHLDPKYVCLLKAGQQPGCCFSCSSLDQAHLTLTQRSGTSTHTHSNNSRECRTNNIYPHLIGSFKHMAHAAQLPSHSLLERFSALGSSPSHYFLSDKELRMDIEEDNLMKTK